MSIVKEAIDEFEQLEHCDQLTPIEDLPLGPVQLATETCEKIGVDNQLTLPVKDPVYATSAATALVDGAAADVPCETDAPVWPNSSSTSWLHSAGVEASAQATGSCQTDGKRT